MTHRLNFRPNSLVVTFVLFLLLIALLYFSWAQTRSKPLQYVKEPLQTLKVVHRFPHNPSAFTQGLIWQNGTLYESTGLYGHSSLRKVDIASGDVVNAIALDASLFGEGITILNGKIYQLTWKAGRCLVYDAESFQKLKEFRYPGQGWGITHNGKYLIVSNGTPTIRFYDPDTFAIVKEIRVSDVKKQPVKLLNELEFIKGEIWANIWHDDHIIRINPKSGNIIAWINLSALWNKNIPRKKHQTLNGIAYNPLSGNLLVTGKKWPWLFELSASKK